MTLAPRARESLDAAAAFRRRHRHSRRRPAKSRRLLHSRGAVASTRPERVIPFRRRPIAVPTKCALSLPGNREPTASVRARSASSPCRRHSPGTPAVPPRKPVLWGIPSDLAWDDVAYGGVRRSARRPSGPARARGAGSARQGLAPSRTALFGSLLLAFRQALGNSGLRLGIVASSGIGQMTVLRLASAGRSLVTVCSRADRLSARGSDGTAVARPRHPVDRARSSSRAASAVVRRRCSGRLYPHDVGLGVATAHQGDRQPCYAEQPGEVAAEESAGRLTGAHRVAQGAG